MSRDMLPQTLARESQHHENEVHSHSPETADQRYAHYTAALKDRVSETSGVKASGSLAHGHGILSWFEAVCWCGYDIHGRDVVGW